MNLFCVIAGEIVGTITSIADSWLSWTIPTFPVMSIEFKQINVVLDSRNADALIRRSTDISPGKFKCTSHCKITTDGIEHIVLWEITTVSEVRDESCQLAPLGKGCTICNKHSRITSS